MFKRSTYDIPPEYLNRKLLISNATKDGLFVSKQGFWIQIEFDRKGVLVAFEVKPGSRPRLLKIKLEEIGQKYLYLNNPSSDEVFNYLVLPEMEIERIFNNLRYKYLSAISISKLTPPNRFLRAEFNKAYQALAGHKVYQGNTKNRVTNDHFWRDAGFSHESKEQIDWEKDRNDLQHILGLSKAIYAKSLPQFYAELIAIKPGFHELWLHPDYFESVPDGNKPREHVFRILRGYGTLSELALDKLPHEINKSDYFSYASCQVTEGPFVFRKRINVSYLDEIRKIRSKEQLERLYEKFNILDYYNKNLSSLDKLKRLLKNAEFFRSFF
jgi:hypothetical protein